ncbi:hypothetical protein D9M71_642650 [compost metagenome]
MLDMMLPLSTRPLSLRSSVTSDIPARIVAAGKPIGRGWPWSVTLPESGSVRPYKQLRNSLRPEPIKP